MNPSVDERFEKKTYFTVSYADDARDDCSGYFDTSCCGSDSLGDFGVGCEDLVITSWTDMRGSVCAGNVSLTPPTTSPTHAESDSSSSRNDKSKDKSKDKNKEKPWRWRDDHKDSSNGHKSKDKSKDKNKEKPWRWRDD